MNAIFKREFASYFTTMVGYIFMAICMLVCGIFFSGSNIVGLSASFNGVVSSVSYAMILVVPILTMRSFAEERKNKSDQLLMTAPVSVLKIVLAKFLSALCVLLATLAVSLIFTVILYAYGNPYWGEILLGYIGLVLLGAVFIALGLLISSFAENQLTACIVTLGLLFLLWLSNSLIPSVQNPVLQSILSALSLYGQFSSFTNGVLNLSAVIYFVSLCALFLFLTVKSVESRRRVSRMSIVVPVVIVTLIVLALNVVTHLVDDRMNLHIDMSQRKYYSISDETRTLLEGLDQDVYIYTLYTAANDDPRINELLRNYEACSPYIHVENVDVSVNPGFTLDFDPNQEGISVGSVIVTNEDRSLYKVLTVYELYTMDSTMTYVYGFAGEAKISSAIDYIMTGESYGVKLLAGHSEYTKEDLNELVVALNSLSYSVETYDTTLTEEELDPQYDLLMVVSPGVDLKEDEYRRIKTFLDQGGNAVFLMDYVIFNTATGYTQIILDDLENFNSLLLSYGVSVNKDYIIGGNQNMLYKRVTGHIPNMYSHTITKNLIERKLTPVLMDCSSVTIKDGDTVKAGVLLETDADTWAKEVKTSMSGEYETGDAKGPFAIAAVAQNGDSKIAVYGTSSFVLSNEDGIERSANEALIMNTVNVLAERSEGLNIKAKSLMAGIMEFTNDRQPVVLEVLLVGIIPVAILVIGLIIWIRRKRI